MPDWRLLSNRMDGKAQAHVTHHQVWHVPNDLHGLV